MPHEAVNLLEILLGRLTKVSITFMNHEIYVIILFNELYLFTSVFTQNNADMFCYN